jgi:gamma-glutamyltranspeptidase/glutathione hydrolase
LRPSSGNPATDGAAKPYTPSGVAPPTAALTAAGSSSAFGSDEHEPFYRGTTSVVTADEEGWLVAVTPSGGWIPAVIAGTTGIGLSQRMQSFVLDARENPFNVVEPGQASARDAHAEPRAQRWQALARLRRTRR